VGVFDVLLWVVVVPPAFFYAQIEIYGIKSKKKLSTQLTLKAGIFSLVSSYDPNQKFKDKVFRNILADYEHKLLQMMRRRLTTCWGYININHGQQQAVSRAY